MSGTTLTFTMLHPDGSPLTPAQLRARTAAVLAGRFARVLGVEAALQAVAREEPALA